MTKLRLKRLRYMEISAVDQPAQVHAKALIMKRVDDQNDQSQGGDSRAPAPLDPSLHKRLLLTTSEDGHSHLLSDVAEDGGGMTSWADGTPRGENDTGGHAHPYTIASDGKITIGEANGHTHRVIRTKAVDDVSGASETGGGLDMDPKELQKALDEAEAARKKAAKEIETLKAVTALKADARAHYDGLGEKDRADFLSKSTEEQNREVADSLKKAQESDPVVYKDRDNIEYRKSDGEKLIATAKRADAMAEKLEKSEQRAIEAEHKTKAETYKHLGGDETVRTSLAKAVASIEDETERESVEKMLAGVAKSAKAQSDIFKSIGTGASDPSAGDVGDGSAQSEFDAEVEKFATEKSLDPMIAQVEFLETAKGRELYKRIAVERSQRH